MPALHYERHTLCQTRAARQRPCAPDVAAVGCLSKAGRSESPGVRDPHHRHVDSGVSADLTGGNTAAEDYGAQLADAVSPDARAFRILLRLSAPNDVCCL